MRAYFLHLWRELGGAPPPSSQYIAADGGGYVFADGGAIVAGS
jgi:hypothetical protein